MAIRFRCSACAQPIEIDDEWASKTVACPYCRKTITAPFESTLTDLDRVPTATPMVRETSADSPEVASAPAVSAAVGPNRLAVVALILALLSVALLLTAQMVLAAHPAELKELEEAMNAVATFTEKMDAQQNFFDTHPEAISWMVVSFMGIFGSGTAGLAAIVCGVIGVRRIRRRGLAIAALVLSGLVLFLFCGGLALGA